MQRTIIAEFEREGLTCVSLVTLKNGQRVVTTISDVHFRDLIAKRMIKLVSTEEDEGTTIFTYTFK